MRWGWQRILCGGLDSGDKVASDDKMDSDVEMNSGGERTDPPNPSRDSTLGRNCSPCFHFVLSRLLSKLHHF